MQSWNWCFLMSKSLSLQQKISVIQVFINKKKPTISLHKKPSIDPWAKTNKTNSPQFHLAFQTASALPKKAAMCNGVRRCWSAWLRCSTDSDANLGGKTAGNSWNLMIPWRALREWIKLYMVMGIHFLPKGQPENSFQPFPRTQLWEPLEPFFLWKLLRKDRRSESGSEFTIGWYLDIGPNKMA